MRRFDKLSIHPISTIRQPGLQMVDLALEAAKTRPHSGPLIEIPGGGLVEHRPPLIDKGHDLLIPKRTATQLIPARPVGPRPGAVSYGGLISEERTVPAKLEIPGPSISPGIIPGSRIGGTPVIGAAHRAVKIPDGPHLERPPTVLEHIAAETEGVYILGIDIQNVMVDPGADIDIVPVVGDNRIGIER